MNKFLVYIGCVLVIFNLMLGGRVAFAENQNIVSGIDFDTRDSYTVKFLGKDDAADDENRLLAKESMLTRLVAVPLIADRMYEGNKIDGDLDKLLLLISADIDTKEAKMYEEYVRQFVKIKRWYGRVINAFENLVKAINIYPKDALIVAKDGDFYEFDGEEKPQSKEGEYQVSYGGYKYVDYDNGRDGLPVRRRDKNFVEPVSNAEEIALAIYKFDIPAFIKAIKKASYMSDGSDERFVDFGDGIYGRILLDVSAPGDDEAIDGVFDMHIPDNMFIRGDFLDNSTRINFNLKEDGDRDNNIKSFKLFMPLSFGGITKEGEYVRFYGGDVQIPFRIERRSLKRTTHIDGQLSFVACNNEFYCRVVKGEHYLKMKSSEKKIFSYYTNVVHQAFNRLPKEKTKHAEVKEIVFDGEQQVLKVKFDVSKNFSQVAVQVEDGQNTQFTNPVYEFGNDGSISALFDVKRIDGGAIKDLNDVVVSAVFDNKEFLRTVVMSNSQEGKLVEDNDINTDSEVNKSQVLYQKDDMYNMNSSGNKASSFSLFMFGLLFYFSLGGLYLFIKLVRAIWYKNNPVKILVRYGLASYIALLGIVWWNTKDFGLMSLYGNPFLLGACLFILVSYATEAFGYVSFDLFRPLKGKVKKGLFMGIYGALLMVMLPVGFKSESLSLLSDISFIDAIRQTFIVWLGVMSLPLIFYKLRINNEYILLSFERLGGYACLIGYGFILWLIYVKWSVRGCSLAIFMGAVVFLFWYLFVRILSKTIAPYRKKEKLQALSMMIQKKALAILVVLYFVFFVCLSLCPQREYQNMDKQQLENLIEKSVNGDDTIVVAVWTESSFRALLNRLQLRGVMRKTNVRVVELSATLGKLELPVQMRLFENEIVPYYVLFSKRYPLGVLILRDLSKFNFDKIIDD